MSFIKLNKCLTSLIEFDDHATCNWRGTGVNRCRLVKENPNEI